MIHYSKNVLEVSHINVLILSYGDNLGQKYISYYLKQLFSDNCINSEFLDVSLCEYEIINQKINADPKDYHNYMRIVNNSELSYVIDRIHRTVFQKNIDVIICLSAYLDHYITHLFEDKKINKAVIFFLFDCFGIEGDTKYVDKYLIASKEDADKLYSVGIPNEKVVVTGIPGNKFVMSKFDAREKLFMYLEDTVCTFLTDDYDVEFVYSLIDTFIASAASDKNLIVACTNSQNLCQSINFRYKKYRNIAAVYVFDSTVPHIAASDVLIVNTHIKDAIVGLVNDIPTIAVTSRINDRKFMKYLSERMIMLFDDKPTRIIKLLESVLFIPALRNDLSVYRKDVVFSDTDINIINAIKNNYIKKG